MTEQEKQVEILQVREGRLLVRVGGKEHLVQLPPGAGRHDLIMHIHGALERQVLVELKEAGRFKGDSLHDPVAKAADRTGTVAPPAFAELVISFLAPKNSVQALLGDLHEMFRKNADRLGEREARRKYRMQVTASLVPLLWHWLKRIGFFTVLVDYFRSKLGL